MVYYKNGMNILKAIEVRLGASKAGGGSVSFIHDRQTRRPQQRIKLKREEYKEIMIPQLIINDVPISCINQAAITYRVPAILIISVLKTEDGHIGTASKNKNGSYDYGPMQINGRAWLKQLKTYGITQHDVQYNPCINVAVGTWILASSIANNKQLWQGVGDYNSATPVYNHSYRMKVKHLFEKFESQLKN